MRTDLRRAAAILATTFAIGAGAVAPAVAGSPPPVTPPHHLPAVLTGHRGSAGLAPENSVPAFELARQERVDYFEVDIQLSADGVPFLFHDSTPARTTDVETVFPGRQGDLINSFTWDELQQLDAGVYLDPAFAGTRIPSLRDAALAAGGKTGVNVELKSPENSPGVAEVLADALRNDRAWRDLVARDRVVVSSFDVEVLRQFHELAPEIPVLPISNLPDDATLAEWATWADGLVTNYRLLSADDVAHVRSLGLDLSVYTVNAPDAALRMADWGVDGIISDFPEAVSRALVGGDPLPDANGVVISDVVGNPAGDDVQPENGEYVELTNTTDHAVDVSGWVLHDAVINKLVVGPGYAMEPGATLRVYTGPGTNRPDAYYNGRGSSILNNDGDSLALFAGFPTLVSLYAY